MKTHFKKLMNPKYFGSYEFAPGEKKVLTIDKVVQEDVQGADGKKEECIVCYFLNAKPMILNVTNCKAIAKAHGTSYIEEWSGKEVTLYTTQVSAFGQTVDAVRVEQSAPKPKPFMSDDKFIKAVESIQSGKTTLDKILNVYQLSDEQLKTISQ